MSSKNAVARAAYRDLIRESFEKEPARTVARIEKLTGLRRGPTQVRKFLKDLGFPWPRMRAVPSQFLQEEWTPRLEAARAGPGHVLFVDAAHFVLGTFVGCLWSIVRLSVRAASGRQRFHGRGAGNAVTRQLTSITKTTVVNTETMCELLRKMAGEGLSGPITLVLDNARYQRNKVVQALAAELGITLLFLPSYSPNLNLIERLWKFIKRRALYGRYHLTFADFQAAIPETIDEIPSRHASQPESLMILNFQEFKDASLLPA